MALHEEINKIFEAVTGQQNKRFANAVSNIIKYNVDYIDALQMADVAEVFGRFGKGQYAETVIVHKTYYAMYEQVNAKTGSDDTFLDVLSGVITLTPETARDLIDYFCMLFADRYNPFNAPNILTRHLLKVMSVEEYVAYSKESYLAWTQIITTINAMKTEDYVYFT